VLKGVYFRWVIVKIYTAIPKRKVNKGENDMNFISKKIIFALQNTQNHGKSV
jgi:hypothetical protein